MMIDREMKTTINNWILQGKEAFLLTGANIGVQGVQTR